MRRKHCAFASVAAPKLLNADDGYKDIRTDANTPSTSGGTYSGAAADGGDLVPLPGGWSASLVGPRSLLAPADGPIASSPWVWELSPLSGPSDHRGDSWAAPHRHRRTGPTEESGAGKHAWGYRPLDAHRHQRDQHHPHQPQRQQQQLPLEEGRCCGSGCGSGCGFGRESGRHSTASTAGGRYGGGNANGGHELWGGGRAMLLASLTTSAVSAAAGAGGASSVANAGGAGKGQGLRATVGGPPAEGDTSGGLWQGFHLPQLSIMRLPGLPESKAFAEDQHLAEALLGYHTAKHGGFPRPCPRCKSNEFLLPRAAPTAANGGKPASEVMDWASRPLRCETCGAWIHLGCAGVWFVEDVPPRPWFHCRACRDAYLRLEAAAERNPHPSSASPAHALYLLTPADLAVCGVNADAQAVAAEAGFRGASAAAPTPTRDMLRARGPALAVVPILAEGLSTDAVRGFGAAAREYDGGKYGAVLVNRGQPVAAATFNVFGSDAQLCLLATATKHRQRGNGTALVADLEATLADLGVSRMFVQTRGSVLPLWLGRLGYSLVPPEELPELHSRLPIAYYDCPLLEKQLPSPGNEGSEKDIQKGT